jgi:predicted TIM-barrel enzyme
MQRFRSQFPQTTPVVLPVIHVETAEQALRNADLARQAGCAGIFLINHYIPWTVLLAVARRVVEEFPGWWAGVNCLGLEPSEVVAHVGPGLSGIWADNAGIDETGTRQPAAEKFLQARREHQWNGLYFGGVAFKYQREVVEVELAATIAAQYMDVVTTSGPGTGRAASPAKIAAMKRGLGQTPLAIASGITPENVSTYLPWADCLLVATGISRTFSDLDPHRLQALLAAVSQAPPPAVKSS